jgi:hypothetical protein
MARRTTKSGLEEGERREHGGQQFVAALADQAGELIPHRSAPYAFAIALSSAVRAIPERHSRCRG